ncbi:hypothetical protein SAMN04488021_10532 [Paracoccus aminovorans]|uniref:Uncharacterized protein n=1 Tax=Paracoccus aminovorans TaxID=34004 RepID=A0A1I2YMW6_9RHOB|nr:hypothetical protein JCM7685_2948 [Paracoccus aminovorans]SFH26985.1 hypothetical protein SAMN04488021_10532 [Paracoccus aminovorans]
MPVRHDLAAMPLWSLDSDCGSRIWTPAAAGIASRFLPRPSPHENRSGRGD